MSRYLFDHLDGKGYDGWIGLEYRPSTGVPEDSFGWLELLGRPRGDRPKNEKARRVHDVGLVAAGCVVDCALEFPEAARVSTVAPFFSLSCPSMTTTSPACRRLPMAV